MGSVQTRCCSICKEVKPLSEYPGLRNYYCRACRKAYRRQWKEANREQERVIKERETDANRERARETYAAWKECNRDRVRQVKSEYRAQNADRYRRWNRFGFHGITEEIFLEMLAEQEYRCAICRCDISEANSHIDHCHNSGQVRAILCPGCNQGLGNFRENTDALERAIAYLQAFREPQELPGNEVARRSA
jgi:hypothetical protein